jgi:hypothetical protein
MAEFRLDRIQSSLAWSDPTEIWFQTRDCDTSILFSGPMHGPCPRAYAQSSETHSAA